ncbi:MAG: manganese catalase family protein [Bacilli bacterium]
MEHSQLPYPEIKVERTNIEEAKILLYSYAGIVSELTAINQYMYQAFTLNNQYANTVKKIGIVEMHHLELLGETIAMLGLDPKYITYNFNNEIIPWNSNYINYSKTDILNLNILGEQEAINNYQKTISLISDKYVKSLLERIILDEEIHIKIFKELKK